MSGRYARLVEGWARVEGDRLHLLDGDPVLGPARETGAVRPLEGAVLLAPATPGKIIAIARNYRAHAAELGNAVPEEPLFFYKPPTALCGHDSVVELPPHVGRVEHEGELALVIGRRARRIREEEALEHVFGYTCADDVTARELQKRLGHFSQAKGYDGFCPLGPFLQTGLDPRDLSVELWKNGVLTQAGRTSMMVHPIPRLVAYLSHQVTLEPGDVILTGTPSGVGPILAGDTLEIRVEGVGELRHGAALGGSR